MTLEFLKLCAERTAVEKVGQVRYRLRVAEKILGQ